MGVSQWIWKVSGREKGLVVLLAVMQSMCAAGSVIFALLMREGIDAAVAGKTDTFWKVILLLFLVIAGQVTFRSIIRAVTEAAKSSLENTFRAATFHGILQSDYLKTASCHSGELLNRMTSDAQIVSEHLVVLFPLFAEMLVRIVGVLVVMRKIAPWLAAFFLVGGCFTAALSVFPRKWLKLFHHRVQEADGKVRGFFQESIESLLMIHSFGCEKKMERIGKEKMAEHRKLRMKRNRISNGCSTALHGLIQGGYLIGFVWGTYGILCETVTYGTLTALMQLIGQVQAPFVNLGGVLPKYSAMMASAERMQEFCGKKEKEEMGEERKKLCGDKIYGSLKEICFSHVSFRYGKKEPWILNDCSFSIQKGNVVALIGQSGIGKSTLMKLLLGVYQPEQGQIFLKNGEKKIPVSQIPGGIFAYVPQGNQLMSGTILEVVGFSEETGNIDRDKVERACKTACAHEFIQSLPKQYETELGERGAGLSEGQIQRLAVARAIYSECPILLLDEATSALDAYTERRLVEQLKMLPDCTVLLITHRREVWEMCDCILEQQGEMKECRKM